MPVYHLRAPAKDGAGEEGAAARQGASVGFCFYLLFMVSWFLHLPARIPALGAIRFDLLLVVVIFAIAFLGGAGESRAEGERNSIDFILKVLCVYRSFNSLPDMAGECSFQPVCQILSRRLYSIFSRMVCHQRTQAENIHSGFCRLPVLQDFRAGLPAYHLRLLGRQGFFRTYTARHS